MASRIVLAALIAALFLPSAYAGPTPRDSSPRFSVATWAGASRSFPGSTPTARTSTRSCGSLVVTLPA